MIIILCTTPNDMSVVLNITKTLLSNKLAACINLLHEVRSFYYWGTTLKDHTELQLLIKTQSFLKDSVFTTIKKFHPYTVPELLVLPIIDGEPSYLSWMRSTLL
ncbi:divalent-cation tolerance protein CutA [Blochmannia endosymbiont of Camponotus sp.]|uniref:divalent-cation tolerance protein CutA n=1 Tax=Blochmannia endosymbiont of Camponotus sp. TaxID=700220 RepID=UPI0020251BB9|nr:divalent-cation tolerance protein CutA [Blochmannia endosymbiont of Camponotus sp.]URJ29728.1 divalent-cation tolerance protein CutA [Blochmannia endosymbiont of Camponotus sp.]URJ31372.1 divalent-cation tolerance protein CutA [Blochmannia endosymbiont of Camponotus sp.]